MPNGVFQLCNDTNANMTFQIEPECWTFTLKPGETARVNYKYKDAPATVQFTAPVHSDICGAIIPGDGDVIVLRNGKNVLGEV